MSVVPSASQPGFEWDGSTILRAKSSGCRNTAGFRRYLASKDDQLAVSTIGFLMLGSVPTWSGILPSFPIDHFLLYKLKSPTGAAKLVPPLGVELADQFETREVVVAKRTCSASPPTRAARVRSTT